MHYYWYDNGWNGLDALFGLFMAILWIVVIIWVVRFLVGWRHEHLHGSQSPLDIAKSRYAKGEMTKEEFVDLKKELEK